MLVHTHAYSSAGDWDYLYERNGYFRSSFPNGKLPWELSWEDPDNKEIKLTILSLIAAILVLLRFKSGVGLFDRNYSQATSAISCCK